MQIINVLPNNTNQCHQCQSMAHIYIDILLPNSVLDVECYLCKNCVIDFLDKLEEIKRKLYCLVSIPETHE